MKLYNTGSILTGLTIFLGLVTLPYWFNAGIKAYSQPELKFPAKEKDCIESKEFMRKEHMQMLDDWRNWALRDGKRTFVNSKGKEYTISLQNTCMQCHDNKAEFCDKCHNDQAVSPYCWDCHIQPEGLKK